MHNTGKDGLKHDHGHSIFLYRVLTAGCVNRVNEQLVPSIIYWFRQLTADTVNKQLVTSISNWFRQLTTNSVNYQLVPSINNWFRQLTTGSVN